MRMVGIRGGAYGSCDVLAAVARIGHATRGAEGPVIGAKRRSALEIRRAVALACLGLLLSAWPLEGQGLSLDSLLNVPINSAAKYAQTATEAAASVTVITADDIRRYGYRTIEDILRRVPDFYTSYDRNYTYLGVRGFSRPTDYNDRVLLLVNGHTMNEGVFGSASLGTELALDPDVIERVEVVQGPGSALYGAGAMFASINIVTKSGAALDGVRAAVRGGSLGTREGSASFGRLFGSGLDVAVAGEWTQVDGANQFYPEYDSAATNYGVAHNLDWDHYGTATASLSWRGLSANALYASRTKGIPTGAFGVVFDDPRTKTLDEQRFVELRYEGAGSSAAQLQVRGYASQYGYEGWYPYDTLTMDASQDDAIGSEARLRWDTGQRNRLLAGLEYQRHVHARYRYWTADTLFYDRDAPFDVFSAYVQDEWQATRDLSVVLGARYDAYAAFTPTIAPRAALVYHPVPGTTLKLLYGEAFRAPNLYETYYYDPISGVKQSVGLKPERIRTTEADWQQRLGGSLFATVSAYHYAIRDLIDTYLDPTDSLLQFRNIAAVSANGVSVGLTAALGGVTAYASYALQAAADGTTDVRLTNSPADIAKAGLSAPLGRYGSWSARRRGTSRRGARSMGPRRIRTSGRACICWWGRAWTRPPGRAVHPATVGAVSGGRQPVQHPVRAARRVRARTAVHSAGRPHREPGAARAVVALPAPRGRA